MKLRALVTAAVLTVVVGPGTRHAAAASVDLAGVPLVSGLSKAVPPNIYFILDDSTSMSWDYMPDDVNNDNSKNCFKNFGYNKIYYNPSITYLAPKKADGTPYADANFTAAYPDGFNASGPTVNLNTSFKAYSGDSSQKAYYYEFTANPASPATTCSPNNKYTKVTISSSAPASPAAAQKNFANWYSYYRTRINMMKSASGRAFSSVDDGFRVGLDVISNSTASGVTVKVAKFNAAQKASWYASLYGAQPNGANNSTHYTPLRGALSKAGRMYAGKVITGSSDPVQYSCQQNFTILTTDGYWNLSDETNSYGPKKEDNVTNVGDQDGVAGTKPPYLDSGKYPNTLADISMYYYRTDLRPTVGSLGGLLDDGFSRLDVSTNNVPAAGSDTASWQHMTLYGLGLGVAGTLTYDENYLKGGSADYNAILQGTKNWPNPDVTNNSPQITERIDDLWHAAVNGRGQYLSASNPDAVVSALSKTLAAISVSNGAAASAATSTLEPVADENFAYVAQYTTSLWYGDLLARDINLDTGELSTTPTWSARDRLSGKIAASTDTRTIYTFSSAAANKLKTFNAASLTAEKSAGYFRAGPSNPNGALTQYATWNAAQQSSANDDAMISFLRGQTGFEDETANAAANRLFRDRTYTLGDIVNAAPVFVKKPPFRYGDAGYTAFVTANKDRAETVYVGANDGMLHAFDAATGNERWAYVPTAVIPLMYKLADAAYANNHHFYVDGPITVGDAYNGTSWKTVLIGGLGRGGRAYYALDVTDPANPKALWEFGTAQDSDLGYSYGNPVLTKRGSDGKWVVLFASSYNNTLGDSKGRLYVVDAFSGALLDEIITDDGVNDPDVSGIARIVNYVLDALVDNTTQYIYGGDLGGSLWRFDLNDQSSQRLGRTSATVGNQPITVRPELGRVRDSGGNYQRVVYFGTGRYLGFGDLAANVPSATVAQAIYAVKDTGSDIGVFTDTDAKLVEQTLDSSGSPRKIPNPVAVDWATKNGWYLTLPVGERVSVDLRLQLGTLVALANNPKEDYCQVEGTSWLYALDYRTGGAVQTQKDKAVGQPVGASIATGLTLIRLPTNKLIAIVTEADTTVKAMTVPVAPSSSAAVRRVGWREIF